MSFLGTLGKVLGTAGAVAGAPFTGGGSLAAIAPILSAGGQVLAGASGGSADTDVQQANQQQSRDNLRSNIYATQQGAEMSRGGLDLNRQQFDQVSENDRLRRALIGRLMQNTQDLSIDVPGIPKANVSGGLRPSALGPEGRALGGEMEARALEQLRAGNTYQGGGMVAPPELGELQRLGGNGFLNTAAAILNGVGAVGAAGTQSQTQPTLDAVRSLIPPGARSVALPPPPPDPREGR